MRDQVAMTTKRHKYQFFLENPRNLKAQSFDIWYMCIWHYLVDLCKESGESCFCYRNIQRKLKKKIFKATSPRAKIFCRKHCLANLCCNKDSHFIPFRLKGALLGGVLSFYIDLHEENVKKNLGNQKVLSLDICYVILLGGPLQRLLKLFSLGQKITIQRALLVLHRLTTVALNDILTTRANSKYIWHWCSFHESLPKLFRKLSSL